MRNKKWHIFNERKEPLCWDKKAIEFDTKEAAEAFLLTVDSEFQKRATITESILYYDSGHINLTDCTVDSDGELVKPSIYNN